MASTNESGPLAPEKAPQQCIGGELNSVEQALTQFTNAFNSILAKEWLQNGRTMKIAEILAPVGMYLNSWAVQLNRMLDERPLEKSTHVTVDIDGQVIFSAPVKTLEKRRITEAGKARIIQQVGYKLTVTNHSEWWRDVDLYLGIFIGFTLSQQAKFERKNLEEIKRQATVLRRSCEHFVTLAPNVSPSPIDEIGSLYLLAEKAKTLLKYQLPSTKRGPRVDSKKKPSMDRLTELFAAGFNMEASTQAEDGPLNRFIMQAIFEKTKEKVPTSWLRSHTRERVRVKSPKKEI